MRWGKTWRLLQKVTYHNKADYSADCFAAAEVLHIWITPAWAGKSMTAPGRSSRTGDHPRVGGEKNNHIIDNQYGKGSPPRRRGKGGKSFTGNMFTRITPAWAGKRGRFAERKAPSWDHPRMGGEKKKSRRCCTSIGGSPPHGRGKARHLSHGLLPCG